jgi:oligopeptide/dipeptide ABC transporter ATP-binding protein
MKALRREMQIIFQDPFSSLNPRHTVGSIIAGPLEIHGLAEESEKEDRIADLLNKVGLSASDMRRYPHEFSGGQRQRIGIARAISLEPKLVVADEPVSALDVSIQSQVLNLLVDLRQQLDLSYIFISHDLAVVEHICDTIAVMYLGEIVEMTDGRMLFAAPKHPYTQALMSAIPRPDPKRRGNPRIVLQGDIPNPENPPSGCRFHTRCPKVMAHCKTQKPKQHVFEQSGTPHLVRCHLYD